MESKPRPSLIEKSMLQKMRRNRRESASYLKLSPFRKFSRPSLKPSRREEFFSKTNSLSDFSIQESLHQNLQRNYCDYDFRASILPGHLSSQKVFSKTREEEGVKKRPHQKYQKLKEFKKSFDKTVEEEGSRFVKPKQTQSLLSTVGVKRTIKHMKVKNPADWAHFHGQIPEKSQKKNSHKVPANKLLKLKPKAGHYQSLQNTVNGFWGLLIDKLL